MRKVIKPELKLGAEPKKVIALGLLLAVAVAVYFMNRPDTGSNSGGAPAVTPAPSAASNVPTRVRPGPQRGARPNRTTGGRGFSVQEFHPTLKPKDPIDTSRVDPTLHLDILARLRNVKLEGGSRSLFEASAAAASSTAKVATVKPIIPGPLQAAITTGPAKPKPPAPDAPKPPPPPIPLKFYGYTNAQRQGPKRAFFLEGEDIHVAAEGDTIKGRYKIIRIGVNSAVVEDTATKNQQTLPLVEEMVNS